LAKITLEYSEIKHLLDKYGEEEEKLKNIHVDLVKSKIKFSFIPINNFTAKIIKIIFNIFFSKKVPFKIIKIDTENQMYIEVEFI